MGSGRRIEIGLAGGFPVVPLASSVELLEDIFDHAIGGMHAVAAVVVADPLVGHRRAALPGDDEVIASPLRLVRGTNVTRPLGGIGPFADAGGVDAVGGVAVEDLGSVVVRIPREYLAFAVQEQLVDFEVLVDGGYLDGSRRRRPCRGYLDGAADDRLLVGVGGVHDRRVGGRGVRRPELDRRAEVVGAGAQIDRHRGIVGFALVGQITGGGDGFQGMVDGSIPAVISRWGDIDSHAIRGTSVNRPGRASAPGPGAANGSGGSSTPGSGSTSGGSSGSIDATAPAAAPAPGCASLAHRTPRDGRAARAGRPARDGRAARAGRAAGIRSSASPCSGTAAASASNRGSADQHG